MGQNFPAEYTKDMVSDGAHYLHLPVPGPEEFFLFFLFPPFFFLAVVPELESLVDASAFWVDAPFSFFCFFVVGFDLGSLFVEAPPDGAWPLRFLRLSNISFIFFKRSNLLLSLLFSALVSFWTSSWSCSLLAASLVLTRISNFGVGG